MVNRASGPLVSVLTTTYNRANVVERAITSVLAQDYSNLEIVLVDNGSTDDTPSLIRKIAGHPKVRAHRYEENAGSGGGRNRCLAHASGKYALYLDSDDELMPRAVSNMVSVAEEFDGELSFVMADCVDTKGHRTAQGLTWPGFVTSDDLLSGRYSGEHLHLFRRDWVAAPGFDEGALGGECIVWNRLLRIRPAFYFDFVARLYHKEGEDRISHLRPSQRLLRMQARGYEAYLDEFGADIKRLAPHYFASLQLGWAKLELLSGRRSLATRLWLEALALRPQLYHASLAAQFVLPVSVGWTLRQHFRTWRHERTKHGA